MTINATDTEWRYIGDGVTTSFAYTNKSFASSDFRVYLAGALQSTGYSVSGLGQVDGGTITFATAPTAGATVVIVLAPGGGQDVDYVSNDAFPAASHETTLDKVVVRLLALEKRLSRALSLAEWGVETTLGPLPPLAQRAGQGFLFDAAGNPAVAPWPELYRQDAAAALEIAHQAQDNAAAALAVAHSIGAVEFPAAQVITLVAGQQDYSLDTGWPLNQTDTSRYLLSIDGAEIPFTAFEIIGDGRTLRLLRPVVEDPRVSGEPPEWPAGGTMIVRLVAAGLTAAAYSANSIMERHFATGSVSSRALAAGAVDPAALAASVLGTLPPIGTPLPYFGAVWPPVDAPSFGDYFREFNGQAVSRTAYPILWGRFGVLYGAGDGTTTFNLPDLRDEFLRGWSASRAVGSKQAAALLKHQHSVQQTQHGHLLNPYLREANVSDYTHRFQTSTTQGVYVKTVNDGAVQNNNADVTVQNTGEETGGHPHNVACIWIGRVA